MDTQQSNSKESEINLLDFFIIFLKHKRLIILGPLALAALTLAICLIISPTYRATVKLMPPQQSSSSTATQLLSQIGGAASMILGSAAPSVTGDLYVGLLQTPAVLDPMVERFDLKTLYDQDTMEETRETIIEDVLKGEVDTKSGIISVSIDDQDPLRAAEMANAFVEELRKLLGRIAVTDAGKRRVFFEQQLKNAHEALSQAENSFQVFQETTGAIKIEDQAAAVLQGVANLKSLIGSKEVQLQVMKTYATNLNPDLKKVEEELTALKIQLKKLEEKEGNYGSDVLIPTGQIPTLGTEYLRKMRDFRYQETLYELLVKQYEAARLDEAREAAVIQVVSMAAPPDKKVKPMTLLMVALALIAGVFFFALLAFILDSVEKVSEDPASEERVRRLKNYLWKF